MVFERVSPGAAGTVFQTSRSTGPTKSGRSAGGIADLDPRPVQPHWHEHCLANDARHGSFLPLGRLNWRPFLCLLNGRQKPTRGFVGETKWTSRKPWRRRGRVNHSPNQPQSAQLIGSTRSASYFMANIGSCLWLEILRFARTRSPNGRWVSVNYRPIIPSSGRWLSWFTITIKVSLRRVRSWTDTGRLIGPQASSGTSQLRNEIVRRRFADLPEIPAQSRLFARPAIPDTARTEIRD
jgi:hypothetical protein